MTQPTPPNGPPTNEPPTNGPKRKRKKRSGSAGTTIGGILAGFDQQVFRTTPPVDVLVAKGTPLRAISSAGGTLEIGMPDDVDVTADEVTADRAATDAVTEDAEDESSIPERSADDAAG